MESLEKTAQKTFMANLPVADILPEIVKVSSMPMLARVLKLKAMGQGGTLLGDLVRIKNRLDIILSKLVR